MQPETTPIYISNSKVSFRKFKPRIVLFVSAALIFSIISFIFFPAPANIAISTFVWIVDLVILALSYFLRSMLWGIKAIIYKEQIRIYSSLSGSLRPENNELLIRRGAGRINKEALVLTTDNINSFRKVTDLADSSELVTFISDFGNLIEIEARNVTTPYLSMLEQMKSGAGLGEKKQSVGQKFVISVDNPDRFLEALRSVVPNSN